MKFIRWVINLPNFWLWYFFFLIAANIVEYYERRLESQRTIMVSYKYDMPELIKRSNKLYLLQKDYRKTVKELGKCKQNKLDSTQWQKN